MRTLEYLVELYPNKTGAQLLKIQKQDIEADKKDYERANKAKLAIINDINTNGGYFMGKFGYDQHFIYKVYDLRLERDGDISMTVDDVVLFINTENIQNLVTSPGAVRFERRLNQQFKNYWNYDLENCKRVTVKEWDEINEYVNNSQKFWDYMNSI